MFIFFSQFWQQNLRLQGFTGISVKLQIISLMYRRRIRFIMFTSDTSLRAACRYDSEPICTGSLPVCWLLSQPPIGLHCWAASLCCTAAPRGSLWRTQSLDPEGGMDEKNRQIENIKYIFPFVEGRIGLLGKQSAWSKLLYFHNFSLTVNMPCLLFLCQKHTWWTNQVVLYDHV